MSDIKNCVCRFYRKVKPYPSRGVSFLSLYSSHTEESKQLLASPIEFELNIPKLHLPDIGISALTGPSGSGKSTFSLILSGLQEADTGFEWWHQGKNLATLPPPQRGISLLFQTLELFSHLSPRQNIFFPVEIFLRKRSYHFLSLKGIKQMFQLTPAFPPWAIQRFNLLMKYLKLDAVLDQPSSQLSGGEKQRTALARALIVPSRFLILDEPFAFLDTELKESVILLLKKIVEIDKVPILLITHQLDLVKNLAQKIFYLKNGSLDPSCKI